jgi:hypothetical protein
MTQDQHRHASTNLALEGVAEAVSAFLRHTRGVDYRDSTGKPLIKNSEFVELAMQYRKLDAIRRGDRTMGCIVGNPA